MSNSTLPEEVLLRLLDEVQPLVDENTWKNPFWKILHNSAKRVCQELSDMRSMVQFYERIAQVDPEIPLDTLPLDQVLDLFIPLVTRWVNRNVAWIYLIERLKAFSADYQRLHTERSKLPAEPLTQEEVTAWTQRLRSFVLEAERNFTAKDPSRYSIAVDLRPTIMELILRLEGTNPPRRSLPPATP